MKFIIDNWMLIAVALASGGLLLWPQFVGANGAGLSTERAIQLINREKAVVIDVSEPAEFAAGHVNGSKNLPVSELEKRLPETVKNNALPIILTCASGARASRMAAVAKKLGYDQTHVLAGGMGSWRAANLPIEKA